MTIKQKTREIAEKARVKAAKHCPKGSAEFEAARLGIIEGLEMAELKVALALIGRDTASPDIKGLEAALHIIRALKEEQKV